jgi:hypothetical protein
LNLNDKRLPDSPTLYGCVEMSTHCCLFAKLNFFNITPLFLLFLCAFGCEADHRLQVLLNTKV